MGAEDWSLHAIVHESSGIYDLETRGLFSDKPFFDFSSGGVNDHDLFTLFPELSKDDDLEDLYKPFYQLSPHPLPSSTVIDFQEQNPDDETKSSSGSDGSSTTLAAPGHTPRYKSRKSHGKRVVIQVSAEDLTSDLWAWRKYGQKPIKGSPFPRSYYRCSTTKGCLARKQVEQSCTNPGKFIITYTAEHSHSQPTRRNSLAGTVRQKFNTIKMKNVVGDSTKTRHHRHESAAAVWPPTRRGIDINSNNQASEKQVLAKMVEQEEVDDLAMSDLIFNQDFSGLEEFEGFF